MTYGVPYASAPFGAFPAATYPDEPEFSPVEFLTPENIDAATIAADVTALLDVENLQDPQPGKLWRSGAGTDSLTVTFDRPVAANRLAFCNVNFSAAAWGRARAYRTAAAMVAETDEAFDSNWVPFWKFGKPYLRDWECWLAWFGFDNDAAFLYWRVDVADSGVTTLEAGRLMLDRALVPTLNMDFGHELGMESGDQVARSEWLAAYGDPRRQGRQLAMTFSAVEKRDALDLFGELQRRRGLARDLVCIAHPEWTGDFQSAAMHCRIETMGKLKSVAQWSGAADASWLWEFSLALVEHLD